MWLKGQCTCTPNFRDKLPFVNSTKSLIFDLTKILLPKHLVLTYSLIAKVMYLLLDTFYRIEIDLLVFISSFIRVVVFQVELCLLIIVENESP